jgi:hypothetical protein
MNEGWAAGYYGVRGPVSDDVSTYPLQHNMYDVHQDIVRPAQSVMSLLVQSKANYLVNHVF